MIAAPRRHPGHRVVEQVPLAERQLVYLRSIEWYATGL